MSSRWGIRVVWGLLGAVFLSLPLLIWSDTGRSPAEGDGERTWLWLACAGVALVAYALPRPNAEGTLRGVRPAAGGTLVPVPRSRRLARVVSWAGWLGFALVGLWATTDDGAIPIVFGVLAALLVPGLVLALRALTDDTRSAFLLAPDGLTIKGRTVRWDALRPVHVTVEQSRGVTYLSLVVPGPERTWRMPEWGLPARAEDLAALLEHLRTDPAARAGLATADASSLAPLRVELA